jgi:hypothetical protein
MTPLPPLKTDLRGAASRLRDKTVPERPRVDPLEEDGVRLVTVDMASANQ